MPETTTRNPDELGALWVNTSAKGDYLSGTIGGVRVVCFKNDKKVPGSSQPDYRVLKAKARDEDTGPRQVVDVIEDDDRIPF